MQVRDEVCGMEFAAEQAVTTFRYRGSVYHFCGERCRRMFAEHPDRYVNLAADPGQAPPGARSP